MSDCGFSDLMFAWIHYMSDCGFSDCTLSSGFHRTRRTCRAPG